MVVRLSLPERMSSTCRAYGRFFDPSELDDEDDEDAEDEDEEERPFPLLPSDEDDPFCARPAGAVA